MWRLEAASVTLGLIWPIQEEFSTRFVESYYEPTAQSGGGVTAFLYEWLAASKNEREATQPANKELATQKIPL